MVSKLFVLLEKVETPFQVLCALKKIIKNELKFHNIRSNITDTDSL
jgi:hypothetical protein